MLLRLLLAMGVLVIVGCANLPEGSNSLPSWDYGADCEGPYSAVNGQQNCGLGKGHS